MRLRNVKNASNILAESMYVIKDNVFDKDKDLHIEIGCGKGDFIKEMAINHPDINFIGIERYESVLVRAVQKVDVDIPNLRFMCIDAKELPDVLSKQVDHIYLNFSDPWPKARHAKRRLTSGNFLSIYEKISKKNVNITMKTDNKGLFAYSIKEFNNHGFIIKDISLDLPVDKDNNIQTEYEKKFRSLGVTINYIDVEKYM